ncbi:MAG: M48 family metallopeptidase [Leptospirales bacterium]|jgi:Zn-dependent protease with chaperone function
MTDSPSSSRRSSSTTEYSGGAFDPALPGGRASGDLLVSGGGLRFQGGEGEALPLPLDGLQAKAGGAAGRLFFFTHPRHPGRTLHTADPAILKDPHLNTRPGLQKQLAGLRRKRGGRWLSVAAGLAVVVLLLYGLTFLKDPLVGAVAAQIPIEWEEQLGKLAFTQVTAGGRLVEDEALLKELAKITDPLVAAVNKNSERKYNYEFHIVRDPILNAFAVPGGKVVLHSGLILAADSPEEIAGVLAHEIAHVTRQHSMRQLVSTLGVYLLAQAFLGDMQGLMAVILDNGSYLLTLKFSRDHESDADEVGLRYMREAGIDPRGMVEMFRKLQAAQAEMTKDMTGDIEEATGTEDLSMPGFLATHPDTAQRIEAMEKLLEQSESVQSSYIRFPLDFKKFQKRVAHSL